MESFRKSRRAKGARKDIQLSPERRRGRPDCRRDITDYARKARRVKRIQENATGMPKCNTPVTCATRVLIKAGNNLLSRSSHYHGPQVLNGRVRNGNGCIHLGMVTGKAPKYQKGSGTSHLYALLVSLLRACARSIGKERINAVKQLAVSTG